MTDPFENPAFRDRTRKLLAILASDQPGEAEAARRKLLMHLEVHGAAWADLVDRVDIPSAAVDAHGALKRRAERAEASLRHAAATAAEAALAARSARRRVGAASAALGLVAGGGAALLVYLLVRTDPSPPRAGPGNAVAVQGAERSPGTALLGSPENPEPGPARGQVGYVGRAGASLRQALAGGSATRPLPSGAPVVVVGRSQFEGAEWFRVRSEQGEGFVPADEVEFSAPFLGSARDGVPTR